MSVSYSMTLPVDERALKNDARPFLMTLFETGAELYPKEGKENIIKELVTNLNKMEERCKNKPGQISVAELIPAAKAEGESPNRIYVSKVLSDISSERVTLHRNDVVFKYESYDDGNMLLEAAEGCLDYSNKQMYITVTFQMSDGAVPFRLIEKLAKKHYLGKCAGFRISSMPVQLRFDDLPDLEMLTTEQIKPCIPVILTGNQDFLSNWVPFTGMALMLDADDLSMLAGKEHMPQSDNEAYLFLPSGQGIRYVIEDNGERDADSIAQQVFFSILEKQDISLAARIRQYSSVSESLIRGYADSLAARARELADVKEQLKREKEKYTLMFEANKKSNLLKQKSAKASPSDCIGLKKGGSEYYDDEIMMVLLDCLKEYRASSVKDGTRRAEIIDNVLNANSVPDARNPLYVRRQEVKEILTGFEGATPKILNDLEKIGLKMSGGGKHIKGKWYGNDKYRITIPTTPSDVRSEKNLIAEINNLLF